MSLEVTISGAATLRQVAAQIRAEGRKDLGRAMGTALSRAADPVKAAIEAEAATSMPSGYVGVFSASVRHRMSRRHGGQQAQVILATYADGKAERRDIRSLNAGILRHPLWGRKKRWYVTKIRGGFHERGTDQAMDAAAREMAEVVQDFAARLIK